jgi:acetyl-CoA carboxylase biotin carboxyl carrier protein
VDHNDIRKIVELMDEHDLSYFHLEREDFNLKLKKGLDAESIQAAFASMPAPQYAAAPVGAAPVAAPVAAAPAEEAAAPAGKTIDSPMVGTFYRKPAPDSPNFVEVGDTISEGQTICIIEAMKVMNEIKAETSGTVTAINVDEATPVQFGDALFSLK